MELDLTVGTFGHHSRRPRGRFRKSELKKVEASDPSARKTALVPVRSWGHYQPFVAPLDETSLRLNLAISNLIAFFLTLGASSRWHPSNQANEHQRAADRSGGEYLILRTLLWGASLLFLIATTIVPTFPGVLAGAVVHSALFQLIISQRATLPRADGVAHHLHDAPS